MRLVDFFQALLDHVSVNLCCRNISVPQHELNGAQIRSPFQQMCGKAVTEFMRSEASAQTQLDSVIVQDLPDRDSAEPAAGPRQAKNLTMLRRWSNPLKLGPRSGQGGLNGCNRFSSG